MLPGLFLNSLVQLAFFCSLASAVNTGPDGAGQKSDSGNALTKSRPEYTKFNKFFVERFHGKKFTGDETPVTPKSPEISNASEVPEVPESPKAPVEQVQMENEKNLNNSSSSTPPPAVSGDVKALEPEKQAGSEQIQLEKEEGKELNTSSTSIPANAAPEGVKVLKPESQSEIKRPEDDIKTGNSTNIEPTDLESKQMNESSGKGVANQETPARTSVGTLGPQNATCPDIDVVLAEMNQEAPVSGKDTAGKENSSNTFSAEIASKYASCPDIDVLAQLNHTEPTGENNNESIENVQQEKKLLMSENKKVLPQAEIESERAEVKGLGDDTIFANSASGNVMENVEGHANVSASASISVNNEIPSSELAKVPQAPMENSEPAEGKHVPDVSSPILNDSSLRSNQEAGGAVIQGDRVPEETSTLTTTLTKYVYAPETSTLWNTHTSTVCDENSPCATAPAEKSQGPRNEAIIDSPEPPVKLAQATEISHMPLSVQREEDSKAEKADFPDQMTDLTLTTTITSTVMSKPMSTYNSTIVSTTCSNSTDCASVKTIRPMSGHVPAPKPIVAYEGKASSLTLGGAMMGALGLVCVFV